ncbi:MAG: 4-(cytidine 5'-diphospho)-2-C-methyl-D-erythritol kinase [Rubrivivax sp.]|nr:4-(cytidine 5'-diphospho)-2-C-methyl-D-erythritol kinase [Rubrivivax sp.]
MSLLTLYDLPAPAKLNLFLHVVGRRADGYHLLQSAFVLIDWADTLHFERRPDGALARHDLGPALPADDLCLRAARALQAASGTTLGADISIKKAVPWGAGMGGGSSDAATTLLALNRLWNLAWPRERLAALGLRLGADVPFFLGGQNAFVEGIGERLTPLRWPPARYAVVKPPAALATRDIFEHPSLVRNTEAVILAGSLGEAGSIGAPAGWAEGFGRNDLQPPAEDRCVEVAQAARWLEARYGNSRMTGSGSAVFARVGSGVPPMAAFPEEELPQGWVGRMCRSLERHPLSGWAG